MKTRVLVGLSPFFADWRTFDEMMSGNLRRISNDALRAMLDAAERDICFKRESARLANDALDRRASQHHKLVLESLRRDIRDGD